MGFLFASFQLAVPFHSRLRVRYGTDMQTTTTTTEVPIIVTLH